ncbi:hypothetical protein [Mesorhizobium sp. 128a]
MNQTAARCWICESPADSAEHRLKKADIVRAYGPGPYVGDRRPVHVVGGTVTPIQGPRSAAIKYTQFLCHDCNTSRTQQYDIAYDRLISWVFANEQIVLKRRLIDFNEVYGLDWAEMQTDLYKYFVKTFGCRLVDAGMPVPQDLIALLPRSCFPTALRITFSVNEDIVLMPPADRNGFIGKGNLYPLQSRSDPAVTNGYAWCEHVSWFTINHWYGIHPEGGTGASWVADAQHINLGSTSPLTDEERADFLVKIREREAEFPAD